MSLRACRGARARVGPVLRPTSTRVVLTPIRSSVVAKTVPSDPAATTRGWAAALTDTEPAVKTATSERAILVLVLSMIELIVLRAVA